MSEKSSSLAVEIDLGDNPGPLRFNGPDELKRFMQGEVMAWRPFFFSVEQAVSAIGTLRQSVEQIRNLQASAAQQADRITAQISPEAFASEVNGVLASYLRRAVYHSDSPVGKYVLDDGRPVIERIGFFLFSIASTTDGTPTNMFQAMLVNVQGTFSPRVIGGMIAAKLMQEGVLVDSDVQDKRLESLLARFAQVVNEASQRKFDLDEQTDNAIAKQREANERAETQFSSHTARLDASISETRESLESFILESKGSIQALIEGHSEGYENIRKAFGERMRLEGPRNYWEAASRGHLRRSVVWLTAFLSLAFVSLAGIVYLAVRLKDVVAYLGTALGPFEWFVIGVPTVIVLWVVRSAHRQWMTHSGLANDAMERVTMVETYLALTNEGKISSVERPLVLNPLFRPSSVKADDGMPGGMLDHIIEVLNKTKSGG